jgi:hypothetical protein
MKLQLLIPFFLFVFSLRAQDIPINPNLTWNGENTLAINPTDSNNLVAAWMKLTGIGRVSIVVSTSNDGGQTWGVPVVMPHFYVNSTSADPTLCARNDGTFFLAYIDYHLNFDSGAVYVSQSNGGAGWSTPVEVINGMASPDLPLDRPWIVVDNSNTPSQGTLYVVTKSAKDAPLPHYIWEMESADSGATWTSPTLVDDSISIGPATSSMGTPIVGADGMLHVLYLSYNPSQFIFPRYVMVSKHFGTPFTARNVNTLSVNSFFSPSDSLYQYSYHLDANPLDSNNLVVSWTDNSNGDPDIFSVRSTDKGLTWSPALRINDDTISNGVGQDMCWAGFSPTGTYAAAWRDRRDGGPGQNADYRVYAVKSDDGGLSFSPDKPIGSQIGSLFIPVDGNDFLGLTLTSTTIFSTWADNRNTRNQVYFNSLQLDLLTAVNEISEEPDFMIYPNPANGAVTLSPVFEGAKVSIYDVYGKLVCYFDFGGMGSIAGEPWNINLQNLPQGFYSLKMTGENGKSQAVKKLLVY